MFRPRPFKDLARLGRQDHPARHGSCGGIRHADTAISHRYRVGYRGWRGVFYPKDAPAASCLLRRDFRAWRSTARSIAAAAGIFRDGRPGADDLKFAVKGFALILMTRR